MMIHKCKRTMCDSETVNPTFCSDHCRWLYPVEEANTALKKENENLSASIKGMASGKANLDKGYQELEGLYERLEKDNAAHVKRWEDLELYCRTNIAWYKDQDSYDKRCPGTYRDSCEALDDVLAEMEELQAGSK